MMTMPNHEELAQLGADGRLLSGAGDPAGQPPGTATGHPHRQWCHRGIVARTDYIITEIWPSETVPQSTVNSGHLGHC